MGPSYLTTLNSDTPRQSEHKPARPPTSSTIVNIVEPIRATRHAHEVSGPATTRKEVTQCGHGRRPAHHAKRQRGRTPETATVVQGDHATYAIVGHPQHPTSQRIDDGRFQSSGHYPRSDP
jgi:hypothetical protein